MNELDELRYQRDTCRAKCQELKRENERLVMLLVYAEQAIQGEYQLRVSAEGSR